MSIKHYSMPRLFLPVLLLILFSSALFAQGVLDQEVSLRSSSENVETVLQELVNAGVPISFRTDQVKNFPLDLARNQSLPLVSLLEKVLVSTGLTYELSPSQRRVIVLPDQALLSLDLIIQGQVLDASSGELLVGANIYSPDLRQGAVANNYGYFSMAISGGAHEIVVSYTGYAPFKKKIVFDRDQQLSFRLESNALLPEVIVDISEADTLLPLGTEGEEEAIDIEATEQLSGPGGEADPIRTLGLHPGITSGADGLGGIFIRGGDAGQNLVLLDGVPVFNYGHAAGLFSIFNTQAIRRMDLYKEAMPARFGGRLSGVLDIHTRDGNLYNSQIRLGSSLGSSRFTAEGPLIVGESSFLVTGRYLWAGQLIQRLSEQYKANLGRIGRTRYQLYDLNFKMNQRLSEKDRVFFSFFKGLDDYDNTSREENEVNVANGAGTFLRFDILQEGRERVGWENTIGTLRWNRIFNDKLFGNFTFSFSNLRVDAEFIRIDSLNEETSNISEGTYDIEDLGSTLRQIGLAFDGQYTMNANAQLDFGVKFNQHRFTTALYNSNEEDGPIVSGATPVQQIERPLELTPYGSIEFVGRKWLFRAGLRAQFWSNNQYLHFDLLPRAVLTNRINSKLDWRLAFDATSQPIHRLSSSAIGLPTDLWVPSTRNLSPARSRQLAWRLRWLPSPVWKIELGAYTRKMSNLLTYAPGTDRDSDWSENVSEGHGETQGIELLLRRNKGEGRLSGWLSYTLSNSERTFDERVNLGRTFPFRYDREHILGIALFYRISSRVSFSTSWRIASGAAYSFNLESFNLPNVETTIEGPGALPTVPGDRNRFRLPADHRLDLNFHFEIPNASRKVWHRFNLGVYNAYNRRNPVYYDLRTNYRSQGGQLTAQRNFVQVFIAPLVPIISYEIGFGGK